jgi:plastocyanin
MISATRSLQRGVPARARFVAALAGAVLVTSAMVVLTAPPARSGGTISGSVTYTGTPPKMKPIDMAKEPSCASQHATPVMTQSVESGPGNTLADVIVYISAGDAAAPAAATQAVRYDQKGCQYIPHVAAMQVNQPLEIYNLDQTSHNIHPLSKANPEWNKSQPPGTPAIHTTYENPEFIPVKCNIHPWMHGYFVVLSSAHFAVTGEDGAFSLKGIPPGKYTVTAWQERFGTQAQEVTITGNETATVKFVFKATPY